MCSRVWMRDRNKKVKNMGKIDLTILQKTPNFNVKAELTIMPLAPLSMVSDMPGSFYKTLKSPDKKMLCGLLENILGWHIDLADRKMIKKEVERMRKKQKIEIVNYAKGSTYIPLLMDFFDILEDVKTEFSEVCFFNDLWSKSYRRADAVVHAKGTANLDYRLISQKRELKRDDKNNNKVDNKALEFFFNEHIDQYPLYYSTPTIREYIHINGCYKIKLSIDDKLFELVENELTTNNIGYLGNSEGWVNLIIKKL